MSTTFLVVCDDYQSTHKTREAAETRLEHVEAAGDCKLEHRIEEVER